MPSPQVVPLSLEDQRSLAFSITEALSCITPKESLSDTKKNWPSWSSDIKTGIKSLLMHHYLDTDDDADNCKANQAAKNEVYRACLTSWLLRTMTSDTKAIFEPFITNYATREIQLSKPATLWYHLDKHYSKILAEAQLIAKRALNHTTQSANMSMDVHLTNFSKALAKFRSAGGNISEHDLGMTLLSSVNKDWEKSAIDLIKTKVTNYNDVVFELKRQIDLDLILSKHRAEHNVTIDPEANAASNSRNKRGNPNKCSKSECIGIAPNGWKHTADTCIKLAGNEHLWNEWVEEKKKLGQWSALMW